MVLACSRCGGPTDVEFKEEIAIWKTRCECGKTEEHFIEDAAEEIRDLAIQLKKTNETVFRNHKNIRHR